MPRKEDKPAAIVLSKVSTGLGTIRALGQVGVDVHGVIFEAGDPVRFSRYCRNIHFEGKGADEAGLLDLLIQYSQRFTTRPVVFPTSDAHALLLAKNFETLAPVCRIWTTRYADLLDMISKDGLYRNAAAAGIRTVPAITSPDLSALEKWSQANPEPYLLKPFYEGIATSSLDKKNLLMPTRQSLLDYAAAHGTSSLIIQRMIRGGDGYIFDCYGYCDRDGRVLTMASHRRWRQFPPDFGTTSYGEIPADRDAEASIFHDTERLLGGVKYHGIFGVEWLLERDTGKFHVLDFNARPFTTIGHVQSCGLNLPALAYADLIGADTSAVERSPALKRVYWADLLADMSTANERRANGEIAFSEWSLSILRCRSFAYLSWSDPGPTLAKLLEIACRIVSFALKMVRKKAVGG